MWVTKSKNFINYEHTYQKLLGFYGNYSYKVKKQIKYPQTTETKMCIPIYTYLWLFQLEINDISNKHTPLCILNSIYIHRGKVHTYCVWTEVENCGLNIIYI